MKPANTDRTNLTLVMPGGGDLPVEIIYDPDETEPAVGLQSAWVPQDAGEDKAIANGAPLHLTVWVGRLDPGQDPRAQLRQVQAMLRDNLLTHPPLSLAAGTPDGGREMLDREHVDRMLGYLFGALNENGSVTVIPGPLREAIDQLGQQAERTDRAINGDNVTLLLDAVADVLKHADAERIAAPADYVLRHRTSDGGWTAQILYIDGFLQLVEEAIAATRDTPGDGASIEDIALPSDVRGDL